MALNRLIEMKYLDTELLRTFLEVTKTRHFGRAAENLYLTQSAVSFRIRQLETQLGNPLFSRQRGNVHLTAAGERLQPYAESILQTWGRAKLDVALSEDLNTQITIGASPLLWEFDGISDWVRRTYATEEGLALRLESTPRQYLSKKVVERSLDLALTSEPSKQDELQVQSVLNYELVLVSTQPHCTLERAKSLPLVFLDWGTRFAVEHNRIPELQRTPVLHCHSSRMAMDHILRTGAVGYLPSPVVAQNVELGLLYPVEDAPIMAQSLYVVYREDNEKVALIRNIVSIPFQSVIPHLS